jgi:hypothetical protein
MWNLKPENVFIVVSLISLFRRVVMLALVKFRTGFPKLAFFIDRRFPDVGLVAIRAGKDFARPLEYETAIAANVNHIIPLSVKQWYRNAGSFARQICR